MSENNLVNEKEFNSEQVIGDANVDDAPVIITHPWHRYFARGIDTIVVSYTIAFLMLPLVMATGFINLDANFLILAFFILFLSLFIEAGFISLFGTTIGKFAFGIKVLTLEGKKLTYKQSLQRSFGVWVKGLGLGIPIVSLFTQISAYEKISELGSASWDQKGGFVVHYKGIGKLRAAFFIVLYFAIYFATSWIEYML
jgi:uncharacterized RDD family membrane protein YckC